MPIHQSAPESLANCASYLPVCRSRIATRSCSTRDSSATPPITCSINSSRVRSPRIVTSSGGRAEHPNETAGGGAGRDDSLPQRGLAQAGSRCVTGDKCGRWLGASRCCEPRRERPSAGGAAGLATFIRFQPTHATPRFWFAWKGVRLVLRPASPTPYGRCCGSGSSLLCGEHRALVASTSSYLTTRVRKAPAARGTQAVIDAVLHEWSRLKTWPARFI